MALPRSGTHHPQRLMSLNTAHSELIKQTTETGEERGEEERGERRGGRQRGEWEPAPRRLVAATVGNWEHVNLLVGMIYNPVKL